MPSGNTPSAARLFHAAASAAFLRMRGRCFVQQAFDGNVALHGSPDAIELLFAQFQQF